MTQLPQHQAAQIPSRIQQAMMSFPNVFVQPCAPQSPYLVQFSGAAAVTHCDHGAVQSSVRESPGLSYLTLPPQTRFYSPCYCGRRRNTQKHFCSPLFIFHVQIDRYPGVMRTLLPLYIKHMLKARPLIHFSKPGAREDCAGQYLTLCSRYHWSSPVGLDLAVTNGDKPIERVQLRVFLLWCWYYFVFLTS